jgi:short-subunit dehydrogenase
MAGIGAATMKSTGRKTACITGATSGIGAAYASSFARQGYDLILTGRNKEMIESVANALSRQNNIDVEVVIAELSDDRQLDLLIEKVRATEGLEVLVNNAGFTRESPFHEEDFTSHEMMLKVHNLAPAKLCHAALPKMVSQGKGSIINVSSLAAFLPLPGQALYSGTKAFLKSFTESIHLELLGTGVNVQVLCPGMTRTNFHERIGYDSKTFYRDRGLLRAMTPEEVVNVSLRDLERNKVLCVPGRSRKILRLLLKILPLSVIYKIVSAPKHRKGRSRVLKN